MKASLPELWQSNKVFIIFLALMFVFRSVLADWNTVPSGSMKPTILEGDRILVNKMAYDLRLPFTHISLLRMSEPQRGDIVVFDSEVSGKRLVKRLIGTPGDIITLQDNSLFINGRELPHNTTSLVGNIEQRTEVIEGSHHNIQVNASGTPASSFPPVRVPADHYLVLGDNRDNSVDSRFIGFVPRSEIVGRTKRVVMSFNYENYYIPRGDRFLHVL